MKWHWYILLAGLGLYGLAAFPGLLPHALDNMALILAGITIGSVAVFGFDPVLVDRRLGTLLIWLGIAIFSTGIVLAWFGHPHLLIPFSIPAVGLCVFGLRILYEKKE